MASFVSPGKKPREWGQLFQLEVRPAHHSSGPQILIGIARAPEPVGVTEEQQNSVLASNRICFQKLDLQFYITSHQFTSRE